MANQAFEIKAKIGLGRCYDSLRQTEQAIDIMEQNLQMAEGCFMVDQTQVIQTNLISMYKKLAT